MRKIVASQDVSFDENCFPNHSVPRVNCKHIEFELDSLENDYISNGTCGTEYVACNPQTVAINTHRNDMVEDIEQDDMTDFRNLRRSTRTPAGVPPDPSGDEAVCLVTESLISVDHREVPN